MLNIVNKTSTQQRSLTNPPDAIYISRSNDPACLFGLSSADAQRSCARRRLARTNLAEGGRSAGRHSSGCSVAHSCSWEHTERRRPEGAEIRARGGRRCGVRRARLHVARRRRDGCRRGHCRDHGGGARPRRRCASGRDAGPEPRQWLMQQ